MASVHGGLFRIGSSVLALMLLAAACSGSESPAGPGLAGSTTTTSTVEAVDPWAVEADLWVDALVSVPRERGGAAFLYFFSPDFQWDFRSMVPGVGLLGIQSTVGLMTNIIPPGTDASIPEGEFMNADGVLFLNRLDWSVSGNDEMLSVTRKPAHLVNILDDFDINGATTMVSGMTTDSWRERYDPANEATQADEMAARWLAAWSGQTVDPDLYAPNAVFRDSLSGVVATGDAIDMYAQRWQARWSVAAVGPDRGVYPLVKVYNQLDGLVLVAEGDRGDGCPGRLAVVLSVEEGRIVSEEWYWEIDTARLCIADDARPDGWWTGRYLNLDDPPSPIEDLETKTGSVEVNGIDIAIYNGTPALEGLVTWGASRFDLADLPYPVVSSVTFTRYSEYCDSLRGRASLGTERWNLALCLHEAQLCRDASCTEMALGPRHTMLHEFAHAWIAQNVDTDTRDAFLDLYGLEEWNSGSVEWPERGLENACETIAWGLLEQPFMLLRLGNPSEEKLIAGFELLTGATPPRIEAEEMAARLGIE